MKNIEDKFEIKLNEKIEIIKIEYEDKLKKKDEEIFQKINECIEKEQKIENMENKFNEIYKKYLDEAYKNRDYDIKFNEINKKYKELKIKNKENENKFNEINKKYLEDKKNKNKEIFDLKKIIKEKEENNKNLKNKLKYEKTIVKDLEEKLKDKNGQINSNNKIVDLNKEINKKNKEIEDKIKLIQKNKETFSLYEKKIGELEKQINKDKSIILTFKKLYLIYNIKRKRIKKEEELNKKRKNIDEQNLNNDATEKENNEYLIKIEELESIRKALKNKIYKLKFSIDNIRIEKEEKNKNEIKYIKSEIKNDNFSNTNNQYINNEIINKSMNYSLKCQKCFIEPIIGNVYKCSICKNYNFCENWKIENKISNSHPQNFNKIKNNDENNINNKSLNPFSINEDIKTKAYSFECINNQNLINNIFKGTKELKIEIVLKNNGYKI